MEMSHHKADHSGSTTPLGQPGERIVKLLGQPHLADYLRFFASRVIDGETIPPKVLAAEWRKANDRYYALLTEQAGVAETIEDLPLPAELEGPAAELMAQDHYLQAYDSVLTEIRWVELAKLVVSQGSVGLDHSDVLRNTLGDDRNIIELFDFCLPRTHQPAPVSMLRLPADRYIFSSQSTDLRFHEIQRMTAAQAQSIASFGLVTTGLMLPVGYGANLLSGIGSDKRIVLQNGYHRAYSLLAHGITHAPMVVERVSCLDELNLVGSDDVTDDPAHYFRSPRPPLLKDFLDPELTRQVTVYPLETRVEIEVKVRTSTGPAPRRVE
ncbi:hypothetical protein [Blastomonas sp. UPD001]|jgi:hypothetical protein|uniref:hypothetical protein n=1 Tax=Blastomonas sp. UPD001 TaxID=2217673 RepID=UPI000E34568E|nr:hypothetical protein [Blastomonas sp. UPD001]